MNEQSLEEFGISSDELKASRLTMSMEISNIDNHNKVILGKWLRKIQLEQYANALANSELGNLDQIVI